MNKNLLQEAERIKKLMNISLQQIKKEEKKIVSEQMTILKGLLKKGIQNLDDFIEKGLKDEIDDATKMIKADEYANKIRRAANDTELDNILTKMADDIDEYKFISQLRPLIGEGATKMENRIINRIEDHLKGKPTINQKTIDGLCDVYKKHISEYDYIDDETAEILTKNFKESLEQKYGNKIIGKVDDEIDSLFSKVEEGINKLTDEDLSGKNLETAGWKFALTDIGNFIRFYVKTMLRGFQKNLKRAEELIIIIDKKKGMNIELEVQELAQTLIALKKSYNDDLKSIRNALIDKLKDSNKIKGDTKQRIIDAFNEKGSLAKAALDGAAEKVLKDPWKNLKSSIGAKLELIPVLRAVGLKLQGKWDKMKGESGWVKWVFPEDPIRVLNYIAWKDPRSVEEIIKIQGFAGKRNWLWGKVGSFVLINFIGLPFLKSVVEYGIKHRFNAFKEIQQYAAELDTLKEFCDVAKQRDPNACSEIDFEKFKKELEKADDFWTIWKQNLPLYISKTQLPNGQYLGATGVGGVLLKDVLFMTYIDDIVDAGIRFGVWWTSDDEIEKEKNKILEIVSGADNNVTKELEKLGYDKTKSPEENLKSLTNKDFKCTSGYQPTPEGFKKYLESTRVSSDPTSGYTIEEDLNTTADGMGKAKSNADGKIYWFEVLNNNGECTFQVVQEA